MVGIGAPPLWLQRTILAAEAPRKGQKNLVENFQAGEGGWMNRALLPVEGKHSPVRAVSLGASLPRSLRGANDAVAIESLRSFQVRDANAAKIFESLYLATDDQVLNGTGKETFEAVSI